MRKKYSTDEERRAARNEDNRRYRLAHPEKRKESVRKHKEKVRITQRWDRILQSAENRAKERDFKFDLDKETLIVPQFCPVLGIPLFEDSPNRDNRPSLDRIDNTKGYTKDNVIVISLRANRIKSDASLEELNNIVNFYNRLVQGDDK